MYVVNIANPAAPAVSTILPLGLTGSGRGSGHIANFVKTDCTQAWVDGGDHVEVVDLSVPSAPRSLGKFESAASQSENFNVSHDTELAGQQVFEDNCFGCHGLDGHGGNGGPSLAGITDVEHVVAQVTNGGGGMPAFEDTLSAQQIQDVAAYVTQRVATGR
jgi:cytochrome c553